MRAQSLSGAGLGQQGVFCHSASLRPPGPEPRCLFCAGEAGPGFPVPGLQGRKLPCCPSCLVVTLVSGTGCIKGCLPGPEAQGRLGSWDAHFSGPQGLLQAEVRV